MELGREVMLDCKRKKEYHSRFAGKSKVNIVRGVPGSYYMWRTSIPGVRGEKNTSASSSAAGGGRAALPWIGCTKFLGNGGRQT